MNKRVLTEYHLFTGLTYLYLGLNLAKQGKDSEADALFQRVNEIADRWPKWTPPPTADTPVRLYSGLAAHFDEKGQHTEVEPLRREALRVQRLVQGENHSSTGARYFELSLTLAKQGK